MAKLTFRIWVLIIALFLAALMIFNWNTMFASGIEVKSVEKDSTSYLKGIRPENFTATQAQIDDLVSITDQRLNAFGLNDVTVRSARDLGGDNFMIVEIAGAHSSAIKTLLGEQGKFEAKIANVTVFEGQTR